MFNFLLDFGNYEDRMVDRYDGDDLMVSTASVSDGSKPYETAIRHPLYNNGQLVIVDAYDTIEEARDGHSKWLHIMQTTPPDYLRDRGNSVISKFLEMADEMAMIFPRKLIIDNAVDTPALVTAHSGGNVGPEPCLSVIPVFDACTGGLLRPPPLHFLFLDFGYHAAIIGDNAQLSTLKDCPRAVNCVLEQFSTQS